MTYICDSCGRDCKVVCVDDSDDTGELFSYVSDCCKDDIIQLDFDPVEDEIIETVLDRLECKRLWEAQQRP